jgi:CBS domain-containing protein
MFVLDIIRHKGSNVVSVKADDSVEAALGQMAQHRIGAVLVLDNEGRIAGILSERDLIRGMNKHGRAIFDRTVGELMTKPVVTCSPNDPVAAIEGLMTANRFRHVPVLESERLVGIVSIGDVVKSRIEEAQLEVEALRRYISM